MKITKSQLKQIIKEELLNELNIHENGEALGWPDVQSPETWEDRIEDIGRPETELKPAQVYVDKFIEASNEFQSYLESIPGACAKTTFCDRFFAVSELADKAFDALGYPIDRRPGLKDGE